MGEGVSSQWDNTVTEKLQRIRDAYRKGIKPEEVLHYYNDWTNYDQDLCPSVYGGPRYAAEAMARYFKPEDRASACVLDVAAGTGFVGMELQRRGFENVDALDPASEMLQRAKQRGCYNNFICDLLGGDVCPIPDDTFDAVVSSGAMGEGHIPCSGILQMIHITKPGGFVCIVSREQFISEAEEYRGKLDALMLQLEAEGYWHKRERTVVPGYCAHHEGLVFVYQVDKAGGPNAHY